MSYAKLTISLPISKTIAIKKLFILARDDYRIKLETQEREMAELKTRFELLQETAGEARLLKDELDILRDTADRVEKYESTIQSYKKKLEELGDLKRQVKILESKNIAYIQQNMELEQVFSFLNSLSFIIFK